MTPIARRLVWAAQPIVIGLALWTALGGPGRDLRSPLVFSGRGLVALAQAGLILESGWWSPIPELRTSVSRDAFLSAKHAHVDQILLRVARWWSRRIAAVVTMAWALMLMAAGASSAWCLRRLGVSPASAWSAGVLFALSPFALGHNTSALGLTPYLVPFAATAALQLAAGRHAEPGWRGLIGGNVALGLNAIYPAVFGAFLVGIGAVAGIVRGRRRADLVAGAVMLGAIGLATTLNLMPGMLAGLRGDRQETVRMSPAEAELTGLKIRVLVSPPPDHWFPPFRYWAERDGTARFPDGGETPGTRLGFVAAIGFVGLLILVFVPSAAGSGADADTIRAASRLTLAAILLAGVGGFSTVFSLLVSPILRDFTFVTAYLAFFALVAVALGIDRATRTRQGLRAALWAVVIVIGVADQSVALRLVNAEHDGIQHEFTGLQKFVAAFEGAVPAQALVWQLPQLPPPGDGQDARMRAYDHFKPFVVSRGLRWSYPAVGAEPIRLQREAAGLDPRDLPAWLQRQGFAAIVVDRFGYDDGGAAVIAALSTVPSAVRLIVQDDRYVALDIRDP